LKIVIKKRGLKTRLTASVLPAMILASLAVASDWIAETSTPSRLTFVEMFKAGIFSIKKKQNPFICFLLWLPIKVIQASVSCFYLGFVILYPPFI
jgi:hypothetical protein